MLKARLTTESGLNTTDNKNVMVFLVDPRANKPMIKEAILRTHDLNCTKVNTLIRPDGQKKAYVFLASSDVNKHAW